MAAAERGLHHAKDLLAAAGLVEIDTRAAVIELQKLHGAVVAGKNGGLAVNQQKALAHIFRDGGKLLLTQPQLTHLLTDGAVLLAQAVNERL